MPHHEQTDSRVLDQLCLVLLSGAFGAICLVLFFWSRPMLNLMLAPQFHGIILVSGVILLGLAGIRSIILWRAHRQTSFPHEQSDHECHHEHDAGWAPWRYVILMMPIVLFLLGFPNKGPSVGAATIPMDLSHEAVQYATVVASGSEPCQQLAVVTAFALGDSSAEATPLPFQDLLRLEYAPETLRKEWKGSKVRVIGQFAPYPHNDRMFNLVRFRMGCCAADLVPMPVAATCTESLAGVRANQWVEVIGTIDFYKRGPHYRTVLRVPGREAIGPARPQPYIQ